MAEHPMLPTDEQLSQWESDWFSERENADVLLINAYAAGADAQLKSIEQEIIDQNWFARPEYRLAQLRAAMRPKPPSLKQQAMRVLFENGTTCDGRMELEPEDIAIIRRALKALPDD